MNTLDSVTHRRAASITKDSEITDTPFPCVTKSLLRDLETIARTHKPEEVNQQVLTLVRARKAINDARISVAVARRACIDNEPVLAQLEYISTSLGAAHDDFPLTVLENASGK